MMINVSSIILVSMISGPATFIQSSTSSSVSHPNQLNGTPHPPRNRTEAMNANTPAVANSPMKKMRKRNPEYSVMYPETSSDSAIGMSNGACVSSACTAIMKITKPTNCVRTNGRPSQSTPKISCVFWATTMSWRFIELAWITTPTTASTIGSS